MNVVVAVDRRIGNGVAISAAQSQMMLAGRVFGSKYSMRWLRSGFFRPVPARFIADVGVVTMLMIGSFGAFSRGLNARPPSGYCVMMSKGRPASHRKMSTARAATITLPPPTATMRSAPASWAAAVAASTERNVESFSIPANVPAWASASARSTRATVLVFDAMDGELTTKARAAARRSTSERSEVSIAPSAQCSRQAKLRALSVKPVKSFPPRCVAGDAHRPAPVSPGSDTV